MLQVGCDNIGIAFTDRDPPLLSLMLMRARIFLLTTLAMIAFAANSLLCRLALRRLTIDAASFSSIRILSGAIALWLIVTVRHSVSGSSGSWLSAAALFAYVAAFSFAY